MEERSKNPKQTILRLWGYLKIYKKKLWFITFMVLASTLASVVAPLVMSYAIDEFIGKQNLDGLFVLLIILGILYLLNSLFKWLTNIIKASEQVNKCCFSSSCWTN